MDSEKTIAITIQNLVQFYSMKNGIDALTAKGYLVDIFVPISEDSLGFGNMFNETYHSLVDIGYNPLRTVDKSKKYKILLEPYPMDDYIKFNFKYRIKYKYAPIAAKPKLTCNPENNIVYDAILCYGSYEANYLKAYANTYIIGNLKYINFSRSLSTKNNKQILLYLPTYGNNSSIDSVITSLKSLKNDYYIITKAHHGTSFLNEEKNRIEKLKDISDEYYDHNTQLTDLLSQASVVLSDNSGSIFEAIYATVPLAIFADDLNQNKIGDFNTTQYEIVKKEFVPYTNNPSDISKILKDALSEEYIEKQKKLKEMLFYNSSDPIKDFVDIIEIYLTDNIDITNKFIHDVLVTNYLEKITMINKLNAIIANQKNLLDNQNDIILNHNNSILNKNHELEHLKLILSQKEKILSYYENGKLYKLSKSIYKKYHRFIGKGKNYE